MFNLKNEVKIVIMFVLFGNPVGIFLFWVGMSVISAGETLTIENLIKSLLLGIGSSPLAIILGSPLGIPLSFGNSLVFIMLGNSKFFHKHAVISGAISGALIPSIMTLYDVYMLGIVRNDEWTVVAITLWLITVSTFTGIILAKILSTEFGKIYRLNRD